MDKILKSEKRCSISEDIVNDLTREMDKYSNKNGDSWGNFCTYIYPERIKRGENKHTMAIRYPGATRGYVELNNDNIITNIVLYSDACFDTLKQYDVKVIEAVKKFIGYKLEI